MKSTWMRFLPGVASGTFWKASSSCSAPPATTMNSPPWFCAIEAPVCSAHQVASGSGSAESVVIMPGVKVMAGA